MGAGLYARLFAGRADVFALRWQNTTSGKSGWSPAVRGGWSKESKARRDRLPLTDEVLTAHLAGRSTVGLYPLLHGDVCNLLVCDLTARRGLWDALAYVDAPNVSGTPILHSPWRPTSTCFPEWAPTRRTGSPVSSIRGSCLPRAGRRPGRRQVETDRASPPGTRSYQHFQMVAGGGFEPPTFGL